MFRKGTVLYRDVSSGEMELIVGCGEICQY
jgi:hypothetical protein